VNVTELIRKAGTLFGDTNNIMISQQTFFDFINDGQLRICQETDCLTGTSTADASTYPLALPSTWLKTKRVLYGTRALNKVTADDLDGLKIDLTYQDEPQFYYHQDTQLKLYPNPTDADTTDVVWTYSKTPTSVTSTGTALDIPVGFHEQLVQFVVMRCHELNENYRGAERAGSEFIQTLAIRKEEANVADDTFPIIRDDPWDDW
jgi:hypothetical protein